MGGEAGEARTSFATVETWHAGARRESRRRDRQGDFPHELLAFRLGSEEYGLDILRIHEILKLRPVTEVPRAPAFVPGVIAVRGLVIAVLDLRLRLRLPAAPPTRESRILIVARGDERFGLIVDGVHQVVRLRDEDIEPPPRTLGAHEAELLAGIGRPRPERMIILLELDAVLAFTVGVGGAGGGGAR